MIEWQPIVLSLKVAFVSLCFVFLLGVAAAYVMRSFEFSGKAALEAVFTLPLVLPPVGRFLSEQLHTQIIFFQRQSFVCLPDHVISGTCFRNMHCFLIWM